MEMNLLAYDFILDGLILPITPKKLTLQIENKNEVINIINVGDINIIKYPGLSTFSFEFLVPAYKYHFAKDFQEQKIYLDKLEWLKLNPKPFLFAISRKMPNGKIVHPTNIQVTLEDYTVTEDTANGFDLLCSVRLKQYKQYSAQKLDITENDDGTQTVQIEQERDTSNKETPTTYTVKKGDTLWNIAKKILGQGIKYKEIAAKNNISNPNKIYPGQVLKL